MLSWNEIWEKSFDEKKYRWILHILFWILYFFAFSFWDYYMLKLRGFKNSDMLEVWIISMILNVMVLVVSYYITISTSYRFLFYHKKYLKAFLWIVFDLLIFCALLGSASALPKHLFPSLGISIPSEKNEIAANFKKGIFMPAMEMIISYFALLSPPILSRFFRDQLRLEHRRNRLEKKNLHLQMNFLKAQVHPHFLFNTLNNIYALTSSHESEIASAMVSGLSSLLRYVLYEGKEEFIPLDKEITLLRNFIDLEAIRSDDLALTVDFPEKNYPQIKIPPFLLLPLVENAFKHGVNSQLDEACLTLSLQVKDAYIELMVENSFDDEYRKKNRGGLGLVNLKKRLTYYYEDTFDIQMQEEYNRYTAYLKLPIVCPRLNA